MLPRRTLELACLTTHSSGSKCSLGSVIVSLFPGYRLTVFVRSYFVNNAEALHFLLFLFSDRSTPVDFQHADIFSVNTYREFLFRNIKMISCFGSETN